MERMLDHGAPLAFVAGIVFNIVPGVVPLVALKDIADLDYSFAATVGLLLGFYVIMFAFIEIPLAGYVVAPEPDGAPDRKVQRVARPHRSTRGHRRARADRRLHDRARRPADRLARHPERGKSRSACRTRPSR